MTKFFTDNDLPQGMDQGPLGSIIPAYAAFLSQQGYAEQSAHLQLRFLADMNQWLHQQGLQVTDLTKPTIHRYMRFRHQRFRPRRDDASILSRLLHLLHTQGILPKETTRPPDNPHQRVEHDFDRYLSEERGLSVATRINYQPFIQRFLSAQFGDKSVRFADLNANDVIRFVRQ